MVKQETDSIDQEHVMKTPDNTLSASEFTYRELLAYGKHNLSGEYKSDAGLLLCIAADFDKGTLYRRLNDRVPNEVSERFCSYLKRRGLGEPVQYIAGSWPFMGLDFFVDQHVLIPRADTECLVEAVICAAKERFPEKLAAGALRILDLCTGSGCIAVSLAHYLPTAQITAIDISAEALSVAERNAKALGVDCRITFIRGNLLAPEHAPDHSPFDILCMNPPYIPSDEIHTLMADVREFEPVIALDGGADGLDFYQKIATDLQVYTHTESCLVMEVGAGQSNAVTKLFIQQGCRTVSTLKDLSGIERVVFVLR